MNQPLPIFEQLRRLMETTAGVENLRFFVDTADGLRLMRVDEVLKLIPESLETVVEPVAAVEAPENPIIKQLVDQLTAHTEQLELLTDTVGDLSMADFERSRKKKKKKKPFQPDESVKIGLDALAGGATDRENVAVGLCAGVKLEGTGNVLVGPYAGFECDGELTDVTALGYRALSGATADTVNVTALGAYAHHTGDHQVVLGDHRSTVHSLTAAHRRSDLRDMQQPSQCKLGLDFVLRIQPIEYQDDFRDAYIDWSSKPSEPEQPRPEPQAPTLAPTDPGYQPLLISYHSDRAIWRREQEAYRVALSQYHTDLTQWIEDNSLARISHDGTHAGTRTRVGFNAAQLLDECDRLGVDMAFVQDHSVDGGQAAKSHSDSELVAVLWRAVQELTAELRSQNTVDRIASALIHRHQSALEAAQAVQPVSPVLPAED